jgi:Glycosyltransferase family 92
MGNLTLCAMVRDEMPYIVEWIEFYRLQGVDHFILYDDGSFDDTVLLGDLYKTADLEDLVEIVPTNPYRRNQPYTHSYHHHTQTQVYVLDHCNKRSINRSQWIIVVDVDEFIHSPPHGSIWNFIESKKSQTELSDSNQVGDALSQFYIEAVRYGSLGIEKNFRGHLHKDPYHGTLALDTEVHPNYTDQGKKIRNKIEIRLIYFILR